MDQLLSPNDPIVIKPPPSSSRWGRADQPGGGCVGQALGLPPPPSRARHGPRLTEKTKKKRVKKRLKMLRKWPCPSPPSRGLRTHKL